MSWVIVGAFVVYLGVLFAISVVASRVTKTGDDFFIANRQIGSWVSAISSTSSSESGFVVLGACGMAYTMGLSAIWFVPGILLGYVVNWYLLAGPLRRAAAQTSAVTLADLLESWLGRKATALRWTAAVIIFLSMMGYVAAQMTATGKAFAVLFNWPYHTGVIMGALVITAYTILGGFRAVAWTDLMQGLLMVFGLVVLPLVALNAVGGFDALLSGLAAQDSALVSLSGGKSGAAYFGMAIGLLGIGLGYPGQPHVVVRYMATRDWQAVRRGRVIAITWGVLVYYGAILLGFCGRLLLPNLADAEYIFPKLALQLLPPLFAGIMFAAIMAAIMSTADSQLLVAASSVVRDLYDRVFCRGRKEPLSDRQMVRLSRFVVLVLGLLSMVFALTEVRVIFWFVLFAWSGLGASFGPLILLILCRTKVTSEGAIAGMITGFAVTIVWKITGLSDSLVYELVPAFLASGLMIVAISALTRSRAAESNYKEGNGK